MKKDIYLPHIHYTVRIREFKAHPEGLENALAYVEYTDENTCTMYLNSKRKLLGGDVLHEIIHVLQKMCSARNMRFELEVEHLAYTAQHLAGEILGYKWK